MLAKYSDRLGTKRGAGGYARAGPAGSGRSRAWRLGSGSGDPPHIGQGVTLFREPQYTDVAGPIGGCPEPQTV